MNLMVLYVLFLAKTWSGQTVIGAVLELTQRWKIQYGNMACHSLK